MPFENLPKEDYKKQPKIGILLSEVLREKLSVKQMGMESVNFWLSVIERLIAEETDEKEKNALRELQDRLNKRLEELKQEQEQEQE
jgi:hypothetical protein